MDNFRLRGKILTIAAIMSVVFSMSVLSCVPGISSPDGRKVLIKYSGEPIDHIGESKPAPNYIYLILTLDIENHGYSEFSTNPGRFYVRVNRIAYDVALISFPEEMKTFALSDGQRIKGKLAFEVPATVSSWGYEPGYSSFPERINVEFIKQETSSPSRTR